MVLIGLAVFALGVSALAWWVSRGQDFWTRLAAAGFLLVPLGVAVQVAAGNLTGGFNTPLPLVLVALVTAFVLTIAKRFLVPAFVVAILTTLAFGLVGLFGLTHPDSFGDFAPGLLSVAGGLLAAVGTWNARRRRDAAPATGRASVWTGAAVLAAIGMTSALQTITQPAAGVPAGAELVAMHEDDFQPNELRARAGDRMSLFLRNDDSYAHTFTIDELDLDVYVAPYRGKAIELSLPADPGQSRFVIWCTVTGHEEMRGTLEVTR